MPTINLTRHEAKAAAEKRLRLIVRPVKDVPEGVDKIYVGLFAPMGISRDGTQYAKEEVYGAWSEDGEWSCKSPFGQPGDVLACRETWRKVISHAGTGYSGLYQGVGLIDYRATTPQLLKTKVIHAMGECPPDWSHIMWGRSMPDSGWKSPVSMPTWAIRHHLPIKSIAVKRVEEITEAEVMAAGFGSPVTRDCKKPQFLDYWHFKHPNASWAWFVTVGE